ncbi:hypothetical protein [Pseudomonas sp. BN515]|uniref:hypothetical protein n=1 Tax=Pseudomonas sp. BN515 TaxID=2567892 RepID=UPI002455D068|nr:hypothetical protein [Pseudomonas sp. BN515]MDH4873207.1 hypothetical protein [Pseudomonas sp. BN515]
MDPLARRVQRLPESLRQVADAAYRASCRLLFGSLHSSYRPGQACATISAMDLIHFKPEPA